ncbi:DUF4440 domain-containing protein [Candidatus Poribacteria bacterium]|nr:DUF4440 domain-containing protein [Candidatus Poribacteria bacterium]
MLGLMQQLGVITPGREDYSWGEPSKVTGDPGTPETNKALVMRFAEEVWNQKNLDVTDELFIADVVSHNPIDAVSPGLEALKQNIAVYFAAFPELNVIVDNIIAEGDKVAANWTFSATHQGKLMGVPASGNQVTFPGLTLYRLADGKIVEMWWAYDAMSMMQQLTAPPEPMGSIMSVNEEFMAAISSGDAAGLAALYTKEAQLLPPNSEMVNGREAVEAFWATELDAGIKKAVLETIEVEGTGDTAHEIGKYTLFAEGDVIIDKGKYTVIWKKVDEQWKLHRDIWNSSMPPPGTVGELISDTIYSPSLEGNLLGDPATRNMLIYLPPSYNTSDKRYPVVYLLHMHAHDETEAAYYGAPDILDELIASGQMKEMIIVMLNANNKYGGSWYTSSELIGDYEGYITQDIVNYIDANYRTIASPDSRAIAGGPMGGNGAITLAMKHPGVYGAVASHSGTLSFNVAKEVFAQAVIAQTPDGMMTPEEAYEAHHAGLYFPSYAYAMSAAFSPNLDKPPYFVDLPLEWPSPEIIEDVWVRWLEHGDAFTMLNTYGGNLASLRGLYIDSPTPNSVGADYMAEAFHQALDAAGIQHEFGLYPAEEEPEAEYWYSRLRVSMPFVSDVLLHEEDLEDYTNVFFTSLSTGLNMISLPLKPMKPYTARSFAEEIGATVVIRLDEARQRFVGFTLDAPDDGFAIEGGKGYIVNVPESKIVAFTGATWTNEPPVEAAPNLTPGDGAWAFVVSGKLENDGLLECENSVFAVTVRNTRTNAVATDVVKSGYFAAAFADLTRKNVVQIGDRLEVQVRNQAGEIASESLTYTVTEEFIRQAFLPITLKNVGKPLRSLLLQNYPNPFNPETWIPYQLREPAEVVIRIYNTKGRLVRTLSLGQQAAGFYLQPTKAAYWDGRNASGEKVASGIYFYQLRASDFSSTRRMLIVK